MSGRPLTSGKARERREVDRLVPAKEIAQIGAATGREFSHALLSAVVNKPGSELGSTRGYVRDAASRSFSSFL